MRGDLADLLMKMNCRLKYAQFGMDFETGKIWSHYSVPVSVIPAWDECPPSNLYGALIKMKTVQSVAENSEVLHSVLGNDDAESEGCSYRPDDYDPQDDSEE